ncbi:MAG: hypothetical protein ABWY47_09500, partial [Xanthobacteraceae bacterium]
MREHVHLACRCHSAGEARDALTFEMKSCELVLDGSELIEPHIGGVKPLDQLGDQLLETAERGMSAARKLYPFDLVDQCFDQAFEFGRALLARSI